MRRRTIVATIVALAGLTPIQADPAGGNPRLQRLFGAFMAPCCWRESLRVHQSPAADELRQHIRADVAAGRTDQEIKQALIATYTKRILAMPDGAQGAVLFWMPWAVIAAGSAFVVTVIRQSIKKSSLAAPASSWSQADIGEDFPE